MDSVYDLFKPSALNLDTSQFLIDEDGKIAINTSALNLSADISAHTDDSTIHFTQETIDHLLLQNSGNWTHEQIDAMMNVVRFKEDGLYVYDEAREKWLSAFIQDFFGSRDRKIYCGYLQISSGIFGSDIIGYYCQKNATVVGCIVSCKNIRGLPGVQLMVNGVPLEGSELVINGSLNSNFAMNCDIPAGSIITPYIYQSDGSRKTYANSVSVRYSIRHNVTGEV